MQVVLEGTSREQQLFVEEQVASISGEGGRPVLVLDGAAFPPKTRVAASRRADREAKEREARGAEASRDGHEAAAAWKAAARPHEPFFEWLMNWCVAKGVAFIVSPFEADEQLVALRALEGRGPHGVCEFAGVRLRWAHMACTHWAAAKAAETQTFGRAVHTGCGVDRRAYMLN